MESVNSIKNKGFILFSSAIPPQPLQPSRSTPAVIRKPGYACRFGPGFPPWCNVCGEEYPQFMVKFKNGVEIQGEKNDERRKRIA